MKPPQTVYRRQDDATLKKTLSPEQYAVTRKNATEPPFQNAYWNEYREGIYVDITTGEPLLYRPISSIRVADGRVFPNLSTRG